jgi:predicted secreted protein
MGYKEFNTPEFRKLCSKLAEDVLDMIKGILENGYNILAIMGIEMSPSCSVNYQYTNKGMINLSGVYIQELKKLLDENNLDIKFIGINRRHVGKSHRDLKALIENRTLI